jgi:hypothetical protein
MSPQLFLHRSRVYAMQPPRLAPALFAFGLALTTTYLFGRVASAAMTNEFPRWMSGWSLQGDPVARALLVLVGLVNGFGSLLVASAYGHRAWTILGHRLGSHPVMESEGPCRLVQDAPRLWGLQMEMIEGEDPGAPWPLTTRDEPAQTCHLLFRLDEAAAGAVSHLFNPGDVLRVRWLDLPTSAGGPTLLEIRFADVEVAVEATEARQPDRLAA